MSEDGPRRFIAVRRSEAREERPPRHRSDRRRVEEWDHADLVVTAGTLERVGLTRVPTSALAEEPAPDEFAILAHGDVALLTKPAGVEVEEVAADLGEDYAVMPDIELSLPVPEGAGDPTLHGVPITEVAPAAVGIDAAHENEIDGKGTVIAVLDSGLVGAHEQFARHPVEFGIARWGEDAVDFDAEAFDARGDYHGTHVSGIATGATVGVAPGANLVNLCVMETGAQYTTVASRVVTAITWVRDNSYLPPYGDLPVIICMSLGFPADRLVRGAKDENELVASVDTIRTLIADVLGNEILCVVAIGNEGPDHVRAPGFFPETLAVGAVDYSSVPWEYTGGGQGPGMFERRLSPDIVGFGVGVNSSVRRDREGRSCYKAMSGTSMAAPFVAGIAALTAAKTDLRGAELRDHLMRNALALEHPEDRVGSGLARYSV